MKANICAGECMNEMLIKKGYENTIPFNEAMEKGPCPLPLFSIEFQKERSKHHNTTLVEYQRVMHRFLSFLLDISSYDELTLWFGLDDFCLANVKVLFEALKQYSYKGSIIYHSVDENTLEILKTEVIECLQ